VEPGGQRQSGPVDREPDLVRPAKRLYFRFEIAAVRGSVRRAI